MIRKQITVHVGECSVEDVPALMVHGNDGGGGHNAGGMNDGHDRLGHDGVGHHGVSDDGVVDQGSGDNVLDNRGVHHVAGKGDNL